MHPTVEAQTLKHAPPPDWIPPHGGPPSRRRTAYPTLPISLPSAVHTAAPSRFTALVCPALHIQALSGVNQGSRKRI